MGEIFATEEDALLEAHLLRRPFLHSELLLILTFMRLDSTKKIASCSALFCVFFFFLYAGTARAQQATAETDLPSVTLVPFGAELAGNVQVSSIADINGDGNQDILITREPGVGDPTSELYLGNGEGGFTEVDAGFTGVHQGDISTADVDGDGNLDLLVTGDENSVNSDDGEFAKLYLGDGQGGFSEANANLTGVQRSSTSIADVNGDGNPDLLITGVGNVDGTPGREPAATLYLGNGEGGFSKADAGLAGVDAGDTSIADMNGDGNLDLLVTGNTIGFADGGQSTTLYLGDGQGSFSEADAGLTDVDESSNSIADVNGDNNPDLLISGDGGEFDRAVTALYLGDGQGGFSRAFANLTDLSFNPSTAIADLNGDENLDLVIAGDSDPDQADDPATITYLGDGQGNFTMVDAGLPDLFATTSVADIEGDGDTDLLIAGYDPEGFGEHVATLYKNVSLTAPENLTAAPGDGQINLDWDQGGDGSPAGYNVYRLTAPFSDTSNAEKINASLVSSTSFTDTEVANGTKYFYRVTAVAEGVESELSGEASAIPSEGGSVSFEPFNAGLVGVSGASTSIGDVNGDGNNDLVITGDTDSDLGSTNPATTLYLGDGQGGFNVADAGLTDVSNGSVSTADVNEDGNSDILITGSTSDGGRTTALYFGNSQGGVDEVDAGLAGVSASSTSIADVNGDGNSDLLIVGDENGTDSGGLSATLYLGDGHGNFSAANAGLSGTRRGDSSIGDVNGDGNPDLLITGRDLSAADDASATLYLGDGQGGFAEADAGLGGVSFGATSIADVNRDGNPDLLMTGDGNGAVSGGQESTLYLGNGQGGFSESDASLTGVAFSSTSIADVNGDGNLDLLITGETQGDDQVATLYLGNGTGGFSEAGIGLESVSGGASSIADVNGDAIPDLLVAGASNFAPTATLYENKSEYVPPSDAPINLSASPSDGQVSLSWLANESNPSGYNVYRDTTTISNLSDATKLNSSLVTSTSFTDMEAENGNEYFYRVTAVDAEGTESQPSGEVVATPPGIEKDKMLRAIGEVARSVSNTRFGQSLQEEYSNQNVKHLASIGAGYEFFDGTVFVDLDDYLGITEEGQQGYVTIWVNGSASIGVSLLPFDLGIIRTRYELGNPDPDGGFDFSAASIKLGAVQVDAFKKTDSGGVRASEWSFGESFEANASASFANFAWNLHQFEIKRSALNQAIQRSRQESSAVIKGLPGGPLFNFFFEFPESPLQQPIPRFDPIAEPSDFRRFTSTDSGDPPEVEGTINYGRGGIDTDGDGLRNNRYPVVESALGRFFYGWEFNLKFTIEGNTVSDYAVAPIEIPDGWKIGSKDGEGLAAIFDATWEAEELTRGSEPVITQWVVSCTDPTQSPVTVGFELYEDGSFSDTPVDTLYVEFKKKGNVAVVSGRVTGTSGSAKTTASAAQANDPTLVDSTRDTPFKLSIETPSGKTIEPTSVDLRQSYYLEADIDSSETRDAQFLIADPEDGNYTAKLEPSENADGGEQVTIEAANSRAFRTVVEEEPIPTSGTEEFTADLGPQPDVITADVSRSFGDASGPEDYRLVALPGATSRPISGVVSGDAGTEWQAYWDNGSSLVRYDGSEVFNFSQGRGFWLTSRQNWTFQDSIDSAPLQNSKTTIPLHGGWNIIANPFGENLEWSRVESAHGDSLRALWRFDGSFAQTDTFRSAKFGEAFYFLNDTGLDSLSLPFPVTSSSGSFSKNRSQAGQGTHLVIEARPKGRTSLVSAVKVGVDEKASEGLDRLDEPAPPSRFSPLSLRLQVPGEAPERQRSLMAERRPPSAGSEEGHTFRLQMQNKTERPVQITSSGLDATRNASAKLLYPAKGRSYDLEAEKTITLEETDSTAFKLAVGSPAYVRDQKEKVVPDEVSLTSYPNPFRRQATIEYTLPEPTDVQVTVYDVLGRRVAVLEEGRRQAGRHTVSLSGMQLSSGVYFGRLQAGDQTRTQKITVVR